MAKGPLRTGARGFNIEGVMRALVILFLVPGFSLGLAAGATNIVGEPSPVPVQATNLIWSGRVFTTKRDFAAWLAWRGSSYQLWATRHPAAARHFPHPSLRSLETGSWVQFEAGSSAATDVRSTRALLIATISSALVLAMLILVSIVRSARFLLEPPRIRNRLRVPGPPSAVLAAAVASGPQGRARAHNRTRASLAARSESQVGAVRLDRRERWNRLRRFERSTAEWAARAATAPNSRLVRHYLPKVTFYAVAVVLSFAVGAWVAIYLQ
jgi:hypothetical protein